MGIFRRRAKPDLSLLQGARVYGIRTQSLPRMVYEITQQGGTPMDVMKAIHRYHQLTDNGRSPLVDPAPDAFPLRYRSPYIPPANGSIADESPDKDRVTWGISMREAADALTSVFGRDIAPATPEPIGDSSSGIEPCGYEEYGI